MGTSSKSAVLLLLVNCLLVAVSSGSQVGDPSESRTVRVMVRKEFQRHSDGSYREIANNENMEAESAPPLSYSYLPYPPSQSQPQSYYADNVQLTADDVADVMRQWEQQQNQFQQGNEQTSASARAETRAYPQFEVKKAKATHAFFLDGQRNSNPSGYSNSKQSNSPKYGPPSSIQEIMKQPDHQQKPTAPSSSASQNSHYYSPKDQLHYNNYDTTGPAVDYGYNVNGQQGGYSVGFSSPVGPTAAYGVPDGFNPTPVPAYGAPGLENHQPPSEWSSSYNDVKHGGGGGGGHGHGGVVNSLVNGVTEFGKAKHHQFHSILNQKGEVGTQLLHQGGKVIQTAVQQKAEKAKIIVGLAHDVPLRFSQVLKNKAHIASGVLDHGSKALGSVLNVKAQVANQASHLIAATGKASSAVIKASGSTAADLIVAKGKGIANIINSGGKATTALLNHKGNKVAKIAEVLSGLGGGHSGGGGYHGGGGGGGGGFRGNHGGWGAIDDGNIVGGYSENQDQYDAVSPSNHYDEQKIQDALKSVVQSPASSYGSPPADSSEKLNSAFRSIYDTFKSGQQQPLFGSYSSPVAVTTQPEAERPSITQSATSLGESLNQMSKMFNNVANAINWLKPKKDNEA